MSSCPCNLNYPHKDGAFACVCGGLGQCNIKGGICTTPPGLCEGSCEMSNLGIGVIVGSVILVLLLCIGCILRCRRRSEKNTTIVYQIPGSSAPSAREQDRLLAPRSYAAEAAPAPALAFAPSPTFARQFSASVPPAGPTPTFATQLQTPIKALVRTKFMLLRKKGACNLSGDVLARVELTPEEVELFSIDELAGLVQCGAIAENF